jgi:hypothetical protein
MISPAVVIGLKASNAALAEAAEVPVPPAANDKGDELVGMDSIVCTCDTVKSVTLAVDPVLLPFRVSAGTWARNLFDTLLMVLSYI